MILGLSLALAGALAASVAFLLEHRGATAAPAVDPRRPLQSAASLLRSRWFAAGLGLAAVAWGLHLGALALAPLSVVQAVFAGGLVLLAVVAERCFGFQLGRRQWLGIGITAGGLAVIALTRGSDGGGNQFALPALIALEAGAFGCASALIAGWGTRRLPPISEGLVLAAAAGILYGLADVALKYLTDLAHGGPLALISPWTAVAAIAGLAAFYAAARSLQIGPAVAVIAIMSAAANLTAIVGGVLVFRETIGVDALAVTGRVSAFLLVIVGAAIMPAPVRTMRSAGARGA